jgi:hypothetical protein
MSPAMDWDKILRDAGIPEPPGRAETIAAIKAAKAAKDAAKAAAAKGFGKVANND